jgi:hypothetical protein
VGHAQTPSNNASLAALPAERADAFRRINTRSFLRSPLVVVGKSLKLIHNRLVGHGFGRAEHCAVFRYSLPRCESWNVIVPHAVLGAWSKAIWSQRSQLQSLARRALKRSTHFLEQKEVRH